MAVFVTVVEFAVAVEVGLLTGFRGFDATVVLV